MATHEFTRDQDTVFASLARRLTYFGVLLIVTGVARITLLLVRPPGEGLSLSLIRYLIPLVTIVVGVVLWRPSDNFRRVAGTEGHDIPELMTALNELSAGFNLLQWLLIGIVVLVIITVFVR